MRLSAVDSATNQCKVQYILPMRRGKQPRESVAHLPQMATREFSIMQTPDLIPKHMHNMYTLSTAPFGLLLRRILSCAALIAHVPLRIFLVQLRSALRSLPPSFASSSRLAGRDDKKNMRPHLRSPWCTRMRMACKSRTGAPETQWWGIPLSQPQCVVTPVSQSLQETKLLQRTGCQLVVTVMQVQVTRPA